MVADYRYIDDTAPPFEFVVADGLYPEDVAAVATTEVILLSNHRSCLAVESRYLY